MSEWQDIATAPKDGRTYVDLWAKRWDAKVDKFETARFTNYRWDNERPTSTITGHVVSTGGGWVRDRCAFLTQVGTNNHFPADWFVTHWQPLPAPPTLAERERK